MQYPAVVTKEGKYTLAKFPSCPGCQTFTEGDILPMAAEALQGWLESHLVTGDVPPAPPARAPRVPKGGRVLWVAVPALLAAKLAVRARRIAAGLTQAEVGRRAGMAQSKIALLESPDSNPSVETLERVSRALGATLDVRLVEGKEAA